VTPERWAQIKSVLAGAMDAPLDERDAYLARECAGDPDLRVEVESLLSAADGSDSFPGARVAIAATAEHSILSHTLGAQYEIVRQLGRGGMGAVYLARERALERLVAIKILRPELANIAENRERFRREARVAAQLTHPGILPLHTFGEVNGVWYFVMGYVRGVTLAERLRVEGRITPEETQRILAELADALACAHADGVVHRDIKPANILLDEKTGRAVLADFGISKVQGSGDDLTASGLVLGTPHFMSPEQALATSDVDERSDIYSLAAVGYTMLAGREPFAGVRAEEMLQRRVTHDPPPLPDAVPPALASIVMRGMARERKARWQSAHQMRDALARAGGESAPLPEELRELPAFGPYAVLWALAWGMLAVRRFTSTGDRVLLLLVALVVPIGFALHVWNLGRHGLSAMELARVSFWPPEWWGMWWPRGLRRPADLWRRLPWPARAVRVVLSAFIMLLPAMILLGQRFETEVAVVAGAAVTLLGGMYWAYRKQLTAGEAVRVLFGATMPSPGWNEVRVVRLLAPPPGGVHPPERDSADDHRRAIMELLALRPASAHGMVADVDDAVRALMTSIHALDAEAVSLSHMASVGDVDRLTSQLSAIESDTTVGTDDRRELAELVSRQLALVRRMRDRGEDVAQRRARQFNLLHGLWTQLSSPEVPESAERLRSLLEEIELG
jgi:serine/threonine-protein kinase